LKITDIYSPFIDGFKKSGRKDITSILVSDHRLKALQDMALEWGEDLENIVRWMQSPEYESQEKTASNFIQIAPQVLEKVEKSFKTKLVGELRLSPSLMRFDGFARYDSGGHCIWFGVDHPDADTDYLRVLLAHELSHVYRDHQPDVWKHLGKPLEKITRDEYLEASTAEEHLASEGLATLNSQIVYPEIPIHTHHYYFKEEMQWCLDHFKEIDKSIRECMKGNQNVWEFYETDRVKPGSPSRTHYYWAARVLSEWLPKKTGRPLRESIIEAHGWPAKDFTCF
jgi:hypothetical protein